MDTIEELFEILWSNFPSVKISKVLLKSYPLSLKKVFAISQSKPIDSKESKYSSIYAFVMPEDFFLRRGG